MRIESRKYSDREKRVLASMALDAGVLGPIASKWPKEGLFKTTQGNKIAKQFIKHYNKHGKPPKKILRTLLGDFLEANNHDKFLEEYASELLDIVEGQQKSKQPTSFSLELANRHFDSVRMFRVKELIEAGTEKNGDLSAEAITKAEELLQKRINIAGSHGIYPLEDEAIERSREEQGLSVLFRYTGDLGVFLGDEFYRGAFISLVSGPKVGKSWFLTDITWMGVSSGCRVFVFELGDLGKTKHERYLHQRITGRPKKGKDGQYKWPVRIDVERDEGSTRHKLKDFKAYTPELVRKKRDAVMSDPKMLKTFYHHSMDFDVASLRSEIENAERMNELPDLVVIDYADLLIPPGNEQSHRHVVNQTWKELRRLALEFDCCVVTATQTSKEGYGKESDKPFLLGPEHFSDSRTKNDHVTAMIGLNQTAKEKAAGVWRLNFAERREEYGNRQDACYVAGNLGLGRPHILSQYS